MKKNLKEKNHSLNCQFHLGVFGAGWRLSAIDNFAGFSRVVVWQVEKVIENQF